MKTDQIRELYLKFFEGKSHTLMPSDSLVPQNDPTLLFTGAGMNQFKEYFLGLKTDLKRATTSQKCLRTGDLEQVGKTPYHHSFFEMLGNFSFGDYFKEEAILWAWEFLTVTLGIPKERLRISVHHTDEEAFVIWRDKIKIREDWIYKLGDDSNFWPANAPKEGPNGPCGPCSEIYYDQGEDPNNPHACSIEHDCRRFAEIWNLVFTQYDRQEGGILLPLKNKNIDTGMGLERLACVLQKKKTNYEIDLFVPIHEKIESLLGITHRVNYEKQLYAIADHVRAIAFAMADGAIPSNEGRGYVIRKLIRRSLWRAHQVVPTRRLENAFLYQVIPTVVSVMSKGYPELKHSEQSIAVTLRGEEERFLDTLETGLGILKHKLDALESAHQKELPGGMVFELYDTYGFPDELTRSIAETRGFNINQQEFDRLMEKQRQQAKQASQIANTIFVSTDLEKQVAAFPPSKFLGYQTLASEGKVLFEKIEDKKGIIVLDQTPFYAESGGQVGDQGTLTGTHFKARVVDTQKKDQVFLHYVEVEQGQLGLGQTVQAVVDASRRAKTMRNHTATHLLHAALRNILGNQVRQLGSLVSPDKLRFDYSYPQALTLDQLRQIEDSVNEEILKDTALSKEEKPIEEARQEGAIAFFGEKYGKKVRVVNVPGFSKEFCGGTHCERTGQIGSFLITSDSSIASGTRRIEALTGEGALEYARTLRQQMLKLAQDLKTTPNLVAERMAKLQESIKKLEKEKMRGGTAAVAVDAQKIVEDAKVVGPYRLALFIEKDLQLDQLRQLSDSLRSRDQQLIYFLGTENEEKINFLMGLSHDLQKSSLDLKEWMKQLGPMLGVTGGGRKDFVQGGGPNQGQFVKDKEKILNQLMVFLQTAKA